jgi:type I restriction enzyme S subunit
MSDWQQATLGDIAADDGFAIGPFGSRMKAEHYTANGVRVLRGTNITKDGRIEGEFVHVSDEFADSLGSARLRRGDIALPHRGAIGRAALVKTNDLVMSTSLMRVRPDPELADPSFVAAYLASEAGEREILQFASTVGTPGIGQPLTSLRKVHLPLPPLDEQRRIASVLGALDDLIETNRTLTVKLEAAASALFAVFEFDREPGADATSLGELVEVAPRLPRPPGEAPYVDMAALPTDSSRIGSVVHRPAAGGARFQNSDTLLARITPCLENGKAAFVDVLADGEIAVGSTEFLVIRDRGHVGSQWPYILVRSPRFRDYAILHMNGSSGRQRVSAESIRRYRIATPDSVALARFRDFVAPAFAAIADLADENEKLTNTRDELLPELMSGRVRVGKDLVVA